MVWVKKKTQKEKEMTILADELHNPIRRNFQKSRVIVVWIGLNIIYFKKTLCTTYVIWIDDTYFAGLVDMVSFDTFNI